MGLATVDRTIDESALPTKVELKQIKPGSFCRLQSKTGTRFWTRVVGVRRNGTIDGLTMDSIKSIEMEPDQLVVYEPRHVFQLV